ncbi:TIGR02281 family clan AA aspartic protease [Sphingomonas parva]|uniref:TIGR02281 family clan AA aspartic protease n=1 Tax=Sphingomonas parva TaxID=2555898 RepID=A0A4Y8ZKQ9_9SPHN|nr:TIGR02281 family clan AA aspartic protease [Sphingomonas parva]TFI56593.1 TIGR02281 family clan AA aspartic protease [Sphingomonas parva]
MQKALFFMIVLGTGIGLAWPSGERPAPQREDRVLATPAPEAAAADGGRVLRETILERSEGGHFYANVEVNGQLVRFLVDTGATGVALTEADAKRIGIPFSPSDYTVVGEGAAGPVRGKRITLARVALDGKEAREVHGVILSGGGMSLLGQAYLGQFAVEMRGDTMRIQ